MNQALFISFLAATFVILIAPGPSCALATSQAMRYGLRVAVITVIGDALGSAFQISIATLGLQVLIGTASSMLPWLQVVGGVYLLYLSYKGFRAKLAELPPGDRAEDQTLRAMFAGFLSCISNPKAIIFFGAFFPGFIDPNHDIAFQSAIYGAVFIVLDVLSILAYTLLAMMVLKTRALRWMDHSSLSAVGLFLIGSLLLVKGSYEVVFRPA